MDLEDPSFPIIIKLRLNQFYCLNNGILEGYDLIPEGANLLAKIFTDHLVLYFLRLSPRWLIVFSQCYISFSVLFVLEHWFEFELLSVFVVVVWKISLLSHQQL